MNQNEELKLIYSLLKPHNKKGVIMGVGDDAAVLNLGNTKLITSVDCFNEGIHFDCEYFSAKQIGMKVVEASASDIIAMGVPPQYGLISVAIPETMTKTALKKMYSGIYQASERLNIDIVGGDTTSTSKPNCLSVSVTVFAVTKISPVYRSGTQPGDLIYVTGELGAAAAALDCFKLDRKISNALAKKFLEPKCRNDIVSKIQPIATSLIDISDGLSSELHHICNASNVGADILKDKIPFPKDLQGTKLALPNKQIDYALNGGEDFELLYTVNPKDKKKAVGHHIGTVTESPGVFIDGVPIGCNGYNHFIHD